MKEFTGRPGTPRSAEAVFWAAVAEGLCVDEASARAGITPAAGRYVMRKRGGVRPRIGARAGRGRYLGLAEREEIAIGLELKESASQIARRIGRPVSTVTREIARHRRGHSARPYRAHIAQARADARAARPKPSKLALDARLREKVQAGLEQRWSPQQISRRLIEDYPDDGRMRISHEAIYQSLYVQGRGELRRELTASLRTGRALRRPHRRETRLTTGDPAAHGSTLRPGLDKFPGMVSISERPAEAADRAVPGHWEGDLIIGKDNQSAIGTLVERSTRYTLLLHLPTGRAATDVEAAMTTAMATLPAHLWRSLTWDQGSELASHLRLTASTGLAIYFCDPHSPWQRGSNENTNGLLRQYFPKGTDLFQHTAEHLATVAAELNGRPRQTLGWKTPAEALNQLLSSPFPPPVARTD